MPITQSAAWQELTARREALSSRHLRDLFAEDPNRFARFSLSVDGLLADFSKQRIDARTLELLVDLARSADLGRWRERLFAWMHQNGAKPSDFFHIPAHQLLWRLFLARYNANLPLDIISW